MRARVWSIVLCALIAAVAYVLWQFPGRQLGLAWSVGTGQGLQTIQSRVNRIESRVVRKQPVSADDRRFLVNLYSVFATGAWHLPPLHQSGKLLRHYLQRTGEPLELDEGIFLASPSVVRKMGELRAQARRQADYLRGARPGGDGYVWSGRIHMSDPADPDAYYALYWGRIGYRARVEASGGRLHLHWRAEVPWRWPRYAELMRQYGRFRAEVVPVPNLASAFHRGRPLLLSNGLGGYLEEAGMARQFQAYAEWDESVPMGAIR